MKEVVLQYFRIELISKYVDVSIVVNWDSDCRKREINVKWRKVRNTTLDLS